MNSIKVNKGFRIESICAAGIFQNEKPAELSRGFCDRYEMLFVNSGKLIVTCGGTVYECTAGTAALFKAGEIHFVKPSAKEYTEYVYISFSVSGDVLNGMGSIVTPLTVLQKQLVLSICNQITLNGEYNVLLPKIFENDSVEALKLSLNLQLLSVDISSNKNKLFESQSKDAVLFNQAVEEMRNKVFSQISLESLADKLDVSLSHLKRIFAGFTDVGVHEYYMQLKICKAKELLKEGDSVTETAEKTGFNNQNYFSAAFKRIVGVTPKEYCSVKKRANVPTKTVGINKKETVFKDTKPTSDMPSYLL